MQQYEITSLDTVFCAIYEFHKDGRQYEFDDEASSFYDDLVNTAVKDFNSQYTSAGKLKLAIIIHILVL